MSKIIIVKENVLKKAVNSGDSIFVYFYMTLWKPWDLIEPTLVSVAEIEPKVKFYKINIDKKCSFEKKCNFQVVPAFVYFKKGDVIDVSTGQISKERFFNILEKSV